MDRPCFEITFPTHTPLLNANSRNHWSKNAKITKNLRQLSGELTRDIPFLGKIYVSATFFPPDKRRRDAPNVLYLSSKAIIDGIVDSKIIPDDCDKYVRGLELLPGDRVIRGGQVVVRIFQMGGDVDA